MNVFGLDTLYMIDIYIYIYIYILYVILYHKTSHEGQCFEIEIYTSSESFPLM